MIKYFCDRCGKELDKLYRKCIAYSDDSSADLCKECFDEFSCWMKKEPVKDDKKKIEDYERTIHGYEKTIRGYENVIHNYQETIHYYRQQIKDLTEKT